MGIYKNTSVALTIGVLELTAQARQISEITFQTFTAFAAATVIYLLLALCAYQLMLFIENAVRVPGAEATATKRSTVLPLLAEGIAKP